MKFTPDKMDTQSVTGTGVGWIAVDGKKYEHSVVLSSDGLLEPWNCTSFKDLSPEHLTALAQHDCEVFLLGTGNSLQFAHPAWFAPFMTKGIGYESMRTDAAARTFNVLANEGRKVLVALIQETPEN